jgi:hypothetical protein
MPDGRVVTETSTTVVVEDNTQVNYLDMLVYSSQLSYGSKKFYSLSKENRFYQ